MSCLDNVAEDGKRCRRFRWVSSRVVVTVNAPEGKRRKETAMKTLNGILATHPFFSGLEPAYLELAVGCASNVRFNAGDLIFKEGDQADNFYLIRQVRLHRTLRPRPRPYNDSNGGGRRYPWMVMANIAIPLEIRCARDEDNSRDRPGRQVPAR